MNKRVLTLAEVENIIVSCIEEHSENYQFFEWEPINIALEELRSLAASKEKVLSSKGEEIFQGIKTGLEEAIAHVNGEIKLTEHLPLNKK